MQRNTSYGTVTGIMPRYNHLQRLYKLMRDDPATKAAYAKLVKADKVDAPTAPRSST